MIKLYGVPRSRAARCLWMLEEMEQPYELVETSAHPDDVRTAEFLRLNPNARIPTLVDGELVVWESLAINLYLAQKYEGLMHAGSPDVVALATQWSIWTVLELEPLCEKMLQHRQVLVEPARDESLAERAELLLQRPLGVIEQILDGRSHLLGDDFTVADLNVCAILAWARRVGINLSGFPRVGGWLNASLARSAYARVVEMMPPL